MHNRASDQGVSDHNSREQQYAQQAITTGLGALTATDAVTADLCDTGVIVAARKVVAPAHPGAVAGTTVKRGRGRPSKFRKYFDRYGNPVKGQPMEGQSSWQGGQSPACMQHSLKLRDTSEGRDPFSPDSQQGLNASSEMAIPPGVFSKISQAACTPRITTPTFSRAQSCVGSTPKKTQAVVTQQHCCCSRCGITQQHCCCSRCGKQL